MRRRMVAMDGERAVFLDTVRPKRGGGRRRRERPPAARKTGRGGVRPGRLQRKSLRFLSRRGAAPPVVIFSPFPKFRAWSGARNGCPRPRRYR